MSMLLQNVNVVTNDIGVTYIYSKPCELRSKNIGLSQLDHGLNTYLGFVIRLQIHLDGSLF